MKTSNFCAGLILAATALLIPLSAPAQSMFGYQVLVDADADAASGCSVTPTGGATLAGFEHRLLIDVEVGGGSAEIVSLERQDCGGGSFSAPVAVTSPASPPWPVGLDLGAGGADAVEAGVLREAVGAAFSPFIRLAFVADDGAGSDVLATTDGSASGEPIVLGLPLDPVQIPLFSLWGIVLLLLAVVFLGWLAQRRLGRIGTMSVVLLVAGLVWAMNFMLDGAVNDWAGIAPAGQDAPGDATDGSSGNELIAGFAAYENGALYFRIDVADLENQAPNAGDDNYSTDEDTPLTIAAPGVLANDSDADGDPITAVLDAGPANAQTFTLNADGSFDYTPNPDFNGSDSFTYFANDGQADSAAATVTITVNAVNDPPVALDDNGATQEDQQVDIDVLANDGDVDGSLDPATVMVTSGPANGTTSVNPTNGVITYTKAVEFNGADSFDYEVCDDGTPLPALCATATVSITIDPVNDAPTITAIADQTIDEDSSTGALAFTIDDVDDAVASLIVMASSSNQALIPDANLTLAGTAPNLTVEATPAPDQNGGPVTITLSVDDGTAPPVTTTFNVTVNPINDAPTAMADSYETDEDTDLVIPAPGVLGNDSDVDTGDSLTAVLDTDVSDGTLTFNSDGSFIYDPDLNFNGSDSFTYHANDGTADSATVTVTITVEPVNDDPNALDDNFAADEDTVLNEAAPGVLNNDTDPEMDSLSVVSHDATSAQGATVTVNADGSFIYDPTGSTALQALAASDMVDDTFTYTIEDPSGINPDTATVTIAVSGVDDPPTAMDDTAMVTEDASPTTIDVQANDTDPDGGSNTISAVTQPTNGTVVITNAGADLTYEPNPNYCYDGMTTDDFTYTLSPGGDTATVAVTVSCVNDPPMADDEVVAAVCNIESVVETAPSQTAEATGDVFRSVADNVLLGDSDPVEGTAVSIVEAGGDTTEPFDITTNLGGSATLYADGSFLYTPEAGDRGVADSFTYTIEDADGGQDTATVTLNVGSTCVWFVDNTNNGGTDDTGTGTSADPFTSLVDEIGPDALADDAEDASITGDVIYVFEGNSNSGDAYLGGFVAEANETILGEGVDLVVDLGGGPETLFDASADSTDNPPLVSSSTGETFSVVAVTGVEIAGFNVASSGDSGIGINAIIGPVGAFVHDNAIASTASEAVFIGQTDAGTSTVTLIGNTLSSTVSDGLRVDVSAGTLELAVDNNTDVIGTTQGFNIDGTGGTLYLTSFCGNAISGDTGGTGVLVASAIFDANPGDPDFFGDEVECPLGLTIGDPANRLDTGNGLVLTSVTGDLDLGPLNIWVGSAGGGDEVALRVTAADPFDAAAGNGFQLTTLAGTVDSSDGPALDIDPVDLENMVLTTVISQNSDTVGVGLTEVSGSFTTNGGNSNITGAAGNAFEIVDTPFGGLTVTYDGDITNASAAALLVDGHPGGTVTFSGGTISDTGGTGLQFDDADGSYQITSAVTLNGGDAGVDFVNGSGGSFNFTNTSITSPTGPGIRVADSAPSSVTFSGVGSLTYATAAQPAVLLQNRGAGTFTYARPVNVTNGTGLRFDNNDGTSTNFNNTVTLNGGDAGIDIVNGSSSSYTFSNTTITSPTGVAFNFDSSSGGVTWSAGGITQANAASAVRINSHSGGTVNIFAPVVGNTATVNAVDLIGFNLGTYNFRGGLDLDTTTGVAFNATGGGNGINVCSDSACNGSGTALTNTVDVNGAAFAGINFVNSSIGASGVTFSTVNVNGAADGINLTNVGSGDFAALGGTIQNITARGVDVSGGSGDIRIDASIDTTATGRSVEVTTHTGGTVDFNGFIDDDGIGIRMENNVGSILRFAGGMDVDTSAGSGTEEGFQATGGGTVHVCDDTNCDGTGAAVTNDVNTSLGTGFGVLIAGGTTIGSNGVTFRNVSVDGADSGIVLDSTGNTGDFEVTGDGPSSTADTTAGRTTAKQGGGSVTLGSGGTITNTTDGVRLTSATDVFLRNMVIGESTATSGDAVSTTTDIADNGIEVSSVSNLVLDNVLLSQTGDHGIEGSGANVGLTLIHTEILNAGDNGAGPTDGDDAMDFNTGSGAPLTGTVTIQSSILAGMSDTGLEVENFSGDLDLTVTDSFIGNNDHSDGNCNPCEGDGFLLRADGGSATIDMVVQGTTFNDIANDGIDMGNDGASNVSTLIAENILGSNNDGADNLIDTANTEGDLKVRVTDLSSDSAHRGTVLFFKADGAASTDVTINTSGASPNLIQGSTIGAGVQMFVDGDPGTGVLANGDARLLIENTDISNHFSEGVSLIVQDMSSAAGTLDATLDDVTTQKPSRGDDVIVGSLDFVAGGGGNGTLQFELVNSSIGEGSDFFGSATEGLVLRGDRQIDVVCVDDGNGGNGTPCTNIGNLTSDDNLVASVMNENGNQVAGGSFAAADVFTSAALRSGSGEVLIADPSVVTDPTLP